MLVSSCFVCLLFLNIAYNLWMREKGIGISIFRDVNFRYFIVYFRTKFFQCNCQRLVSIWFYFVLKLKSVIYINLSRIESSRSTRCSCNCVSIQFNVAWTVYTNYPEDDYLSHSIDFFARSLFKVLCCYRYSVFFSFRCNIEHLSRFS